MKAIDKQKRYSVFLVTQDAEGLPIGDIYAYTEHAAVYERLKCPVRKVHQSGLRGVTDYLATCYAAVPTSDVPSDNSGNWLLAYNWWAETRYGG